MIDPELLPFLAFWDAAWAAAPPVATIADRRARIEALAAGLRPALPDGLVEEERIAAHAGRSVRVRVFRRTGDTDAPCLVFLHGGGFVMGSPETHADIAMVIARDAGWTVVSVDYALAPERPFPAGFDDVGTALDWVRASAADLGVRADAVAVGGDSAGGNLAAAICLARRGAPSAPVGQLLFYPAVDTGSSRPSYVENADGPIITSAGVRGTWSTYCPDESLWRDPRVAPLLAPDHAGSPPAFVAVAEHDPLRDDGRAYADALRAAGVPVAFRPGTGLIHGHLRAMSYCAAARAELAAACDWLRILAPR
ncbi:MAG: alpha/beta hydrolase [Rhodospirillales bacterium]|nr:alpha/beta hydrolase [Rhodospirillales bacterium]